MKLLHWSFYNALCCYCCAEANVALRGSATTPSALIRQSVLHVLSPSEWYSHKSEQKQYASFLLSECFLCMQAVVYIPFYSSCWTSRVSESWPQLTLHSSSPDVCANPITGFEWDFCRQNGSFVDRFTDKVLQMRSSQERNTTTFSYSFCMVRLPLEASNREMKCHRLPALDPFSRRG